MNKKKAWYNNCVPTAEKRSLKTEGRNEQWRSSKSMKNTKLETNKINALHSSWRRRIRLGAESEETRTQLQGSPPRTCRTGRAPIDDKTPAFTWMHWKPSTNDSLPATLQINRTYMYKMTSLVTNHKEHLQSRLWYPYLRLNHYKANKPSLDECFFYIKVFTKQAATQMNFLHSNCTIHVQGRIAHIPDWNKRNGNP